YLLDASALLVPEPASLVLLGIGAALLLSSRASRNRFRWLIHRGPIAAVPIMTTLCLTLSPCARALEQPYVGIDLFPIPDGGAYAANAGQVVGEAANIHATLWTGPAGAAIDLNPAPRNTFVFDSSVAYATSGTQQVGYATVATYGLDHAFLWNG